MLSVGLRLE